MNFIESYINFIVNDPISFLFYLGLGAGIQTVYIYLRSRKNKSKVENKIDYRSL